MELWITLNKGEVKTLDNLSKKYWYLSNNVYIKIIVWVVCQMNSNLFLVWIANQVISNSFYIILKVVCWIVFWGKITFWIVRVQIIIFFSWAFNVCLTHSISHISIFLYIFSFFFYTFSFSFHSKHVFFYYISIFITF